jgi:2-dehydro-3-deoxygalactonokinase
MSVYAVVDSGTTTTRLRLWREGRVVWSGSRQAGARDTAVDGHAGKVLAALRSLLDECGASPAAIVCSGMITSNLGLYELPHLPAPAGLDDLAAGIRQKVFPELSEVPLSFVPGVKTLPSPGLAGLAEGDVLRGEEAEVAGLHPELALGEDAVYMHTGSHHKALDVDAQGRILASRTAITGELLAAVIGNTVLRSSVVPLDGLELDMEAALAGASAAREHGVGRALFLVRVGEQLAGQDKARMTSYLVGVLAALDVHLLPSDAGAPVVLYGGDHFVRVLLQVLPAHGYERVRLVEGQVADEAAARGAVRLYERARELGVVA